MDFSKIEQLEKAFIGTLITRQKAFHEIADLHFQPEFLTVFKHQKFYETIAKLIDSGKQATIFTVYNDLEKRGMVEPEDKIYLTDCAAEAIIANLKPLAMRLAEFYIRRKSDEVGTWFKNRAFSPSADPFETLDGGVKKISEVTGFLRTGKIHHISDITNDWLNDLESKMAAHRDGVKMTGITTGIPDIDEMTGGLQGGKLYILAARPSMGKSAIGAGHMPLSAAMAGHSVGIVSIEMPEREIYARCIASIAEIDGIKIDRGAITDQELQKINRAIGVFDRLPIYIDDGPQDIASLKTSIRLWVRQHGLKAIYIDYLQKIKAPGMQRHLQIAEISGGLKELAKELDIPIIALAQLSRKIEDRSQRLPMMSDLRESGDIEQDADVVLSLYRPNYYGREYMMRNYSDWIMNIQNHFGESAKYRLRYLVMVSVLKQRGGMTGDSWNYLKLPIYKVEPVESHVRRWITGDSGDSIHETNGNEEMPF
jgi:replicative DNA helicase